MTVRHNKTDAIDDLRLELENISDEVETFNRHVPEDGTKSVLTEVNLEEMDAEEIYKVAYKVNEIYGQLSDLLKSTIYK